MTDHSSSDFVILDSNTPPPEHDVITPEHDVITPEHDVITPEHDVITPEHDVITPEHDVITPEHDVITPEHDVITPEHDVITPENPGALLDSYSLVTPPPTSSSSVDPALFCPEDDVTTASEEISVLSERDGLSPDSERDGTRDGVSPDSERDGTSPDRTSEGVHLMKTDSTNSVDEHLMKTDSTNSVEVEEMEKIPEIVEDEVVSELSELVLSKEPAQPTSEPEPELEVEKEIEEPVSEERPGVEPVEEAMNEEEVAEDEPMEVDEDVPPTLTPTIDQQVEPEFSPPSSNEESVGSDGELPSYITLQGSDVTEGAGDVTAPANVMKPWCHMISALTLTLTLANLYSTEVAPDALELALSTLFLAYLATYTAVDREWVPVTSSLRDWLHELFNRVICPALISYLGIYTLSYQTNNLLVPALLILLGGELLVLIDHINLKYISAGVVACCIGNVVYEALRGIGEVQPLIHDQEL